VNWPDTISSADYPKPHGAGGHEVQRRATFQGTALATPDDDNGPSMKKPGVALIFALSTVPAFAQNRAVLHIQPTGDGFENYLATAMAKKHVPAEIVDNQARATLTLKATPLQVRKDSTGTKALKCAFGDCHGIDNRASASVRLVNRDGTVVWSYSVTGDQDDRDRIAETIAKHLKSEYFESKGAQR